jgi:hypothetical protein
LLDQTPESDFILNQTLPVHVVLNVMTIWCGSPTVKNEDIFVLDVRSTPFTYTEEILLFDITPELFQEYDTFPVPTLEYNK